MSQEKLSLKTLNNLTRLATLSLLLVTVWAVVAIRGRFGPRLEEEKERLIEDKCDKGRERL